MGLVLIGIAFVYVWLAKSGNGLEKYTDIVCEYTSIWNSNKSGERMLAYVLAALGSCAIVAYYVIELKRERIVPLMNIKDNDERILKIAMIALIVMVTTDFFVYSKKSIFVMVALAVIVLFYVLNKTIALSGTVFFLSCIYAIIGIYRVYVCGGGQ